MRGPRHAPCPSSRARALGGERLDLGDHRTGKERLEASGQPSRDVRELHGAPLFFSALTMLQRGREASQGVRRSMSPLRRTGPCVERNCCIAGSGAPLRTEQRTPRARRSLRGFQMGRVLFAVLAAVAVWGCEGATVQVRPAPVFSCATGPQPVDLAVLAGLLMLRSLAERGLDPKS